MEDLEVLFVEWPPKKEPQDHQIKERRRPKPHRKPHEMKDAYDPTHHLFGFGGKGVD